MNQVVIDNPLIDSLFDEPARHFRLTDRGIMNEIGDGRPTSSYFAELAKRCAAERIDGVQLVWILRG
jgi:type III restriction enzyme